MKGNIWNIRALRIIPSGINHKQSEDDRTGDSGTAYIAKALIFLSLGFTISCCSIFNWDLGQIQMFASGVISIAIGVRFLGLYLKEMEPDTIPAYVSNKTQRN